MSHGNGRRILLSDESVEVKWIFDTFVHSANRDFIGIPKVFVFQVRCSQDLHVGFLIWQRVFTN